MANVSFDEIDVTRVQYGPQKAKPGKRYENKTGLRWDKHPVTLAALMVLYLYSALWGSDDDFRAKKPGKDLLYTSQRMMEMLNAVIPEVFTVYLEKTGKPLTAEVVYDRFHKMFYGPVPAGTSVAGEDSHCQLSREHPKQHPLRRKAMKIVEKRIRQVGWFAPNLGNWDYAELNELIENEKVRGTRKNSGD